METRCSFFMRKYVGGTCKSNDFFSVVQTIAGSRFNGPGQSRICRSAVTS